jgi:hypothetical protein
LKHIWTSISEAKDPIRVEDPANPSGNDLTEFLKAVWPELSARAKDTLDLLQQSGWEAVFGRLGMDDEPNGGKSAAFVRAAAAVRTPTKPWIP